MVSAHSIEEQLKRIHFNQHGWGRSEARELPHIILPDEEIYEVVNGIYEGGFALLVATDIRVLLIDKKPMNFLTVEDLRFDMINEIDYNHRMIGARISISAGAKNLKFRSYNQQRLRKLITHVQHCIADGKRQQVDQQVDQKQHLEQINQQLQAYLIAQHQNQTQMQQRMERAENIGSTIVPMPQQLEPLRPSPELSDFLYAQSLLADYRKNEAQGRPQPTVPDAPSRIEQTPELQKMIDPALGSDDRLKMDIYQAGLEEIYSRKNSIEQNNLQIAQTETDPQPNSIEVNALRIAYSKLPMALRNRKFGRPSFHAHSQNEDLTPSYPQPAPAVSLQ